MIRMHLFIGERAVMQLKRLAKFTGTSVAEHIRRAVDAYLKGGGK